MRPACPSSGRGGRWNVNPRGPLLAGLLGGALLLLSACSLAGDVTPPPGSRASTPSTPSTLIAAPATEPAPTTLPVTRPLAAAGALLFADHCAACHGDQGKGDGPMAAQLSAQRPGPLPDFSSPDLARSTTPAAWFQVITQGRLQKLMPPWADELSAADRWDLVGFLYTLSTPPSQIDTGKVVYEANCARCHGASGQGEGADAATLSQPPPDFTDQAYMTAHSQADFFAALAEGVGQEMPAFEPSLSEEERWAVLDYIRALSYEYTAPEAALAETPGTVTGILRNGTAGASVPAGQPVVLYAFDDVNQTLDLTTTVSASGAFKFENVPYTPRRQFVVAATYQGLVYSSEVSAFDSGQAVLDLPLAIYETTSDPSAVHVDRMHVFFDFPAGKVTVGEAHIFSNDGDKTFWNPEGAGVEIALPPSATNLNVQNGREGVDYFRTPQGFANTVPIRPGAGTARLIFSFDLPYERSLKFAQTVLYPVGTVNVLLPDVGVKLNGDHLQDLGPQDIQGAPYQTYVASDLAAGATLAFQLSGRPDATTAGLVASSPAAIAVGAGSLGLVLLGIGGWWYLRRSRSEATEGLPTDREALLQAIADLDDAFEGGQLGEGEYVRRRARLKDRLMESWEGS